MPEKIDEARQLCGEKLLRLLSENAAFLTKRYGVKENVVLNLLPAVRNDQWFERDFVTEHYKAEGRSIIAGRIAEQLKRSGWN